MCVLKEVLLFALVIVTATEPRGVKSERNAADMAFSGLAFELILTKLEYLEEKFVELEATIKRDRDIANQKLSIAIAQLNQNLRHDRKALELKLSHQEKISQRLLVCVNQLNKTVSATQIQWKKDGESFVQQTSRIGDTINLMSQHFINTIEKDQETIEQKLKHQEKASEGLLSAVNLLDHNVTGIQNADLPLVFGSCNPLKQSGKYNILPISNDEPFTGYCEQNTFGGGWLVIQYRYDGSENFHRNWNNYSSGFGSLDGEFWLGLEHVHRLTSARPHELLVELKDFKGVYKYARYSKFEVGSKEEQYSLKKLGSYSGTAGDSFLFFTHAGFSTFDRNNDLDLYRCSSVFRGAWWHSGCTTSNLNGFYSEEFHVSSITWFNFKEGDITTSLAYSKMLIREI